MVGHKDSVTCIAEDGYILLTGSDDMSIGIWNTRNWQLLGSGGGKKKRVEAIGFMHGH
jgi:WD40 repeat protein